MGPTDVKQDKENNGVVRFENVSHVYQTNDIEINALRNVTLQIHKGQYVSVIGHNGSGKSTLAKHINGLLLPSQGVVTVCGIDTSDKEMIWEVRRSAGMVFQNPDNQLVATSVEDDVAFGLENLGLLGEEINLRISDALKRTNITELRNVEPHRLSGGQKQRVAIAGIIAMKPEVLILDEATAMLDPAGRREVLDTIRYLNQSEGMAIINMTHHLEETLYSDYIVVFHKGEVLMKGTPQYVYSQEDKLRSVGLDVPFSVQLRNRLNSKGWKIDGNGTSLDELVEAIWKSL